jgi:hypothetical protein
MQLRHTFLRVLHPLLTKTQLRSIPYKRPQIVQALESLMHNGYIRDINPTTKRLVERCLAGEWCVQFRTNPQDRNTRAQSPSSESVASAAQAQANLEIILGSSMSSSAQLERSGSLTKGKTLKLSKSMEFVKGSAHKPPPRSPVDYIRRPSKSSASSLPGAASNIPPVPHVATQSKRRDMTGVRSAEIDGDFATKSDRHRQAHDDSISQHPQERPPVNTPPSPIHVSSSTSMTSPTILSQVQTQTPHRRSAPPAPGKRRKPPAVPAGRLNGHATITTIKSSASSPLSMITKSSNSKQSML